MSEDTQEEENKDPEIIEVGQEFSLFDTKRLKIFSQWLNLPPRRVIFEGGFILRTNTFFDLPMDIYLNHKLFNDLSNADFFAPFSRGEGYQVTAEDFQIESRKAKVILAKKPVINNGMVLEVYSNATENEKLLISNKPTNDTPNYEFKPEAVEKLKNLRLLLTFPSGTYISDITFDDVLAELRFESFRPVDSQPLAFDEALSRPLDRNGLFIVLPLPVNEPMPANMPNPPEYKKEVYEQIKAKFIFDGPQN